MQFIANYWFVWLVVMLGFGGYAAYNQIRRMKGMFALESVSDAPGNFFRGVGTMFVAAAIAGISSILLLIAVVIHLVTYLK